MPELTVKDSEQNSLRISLFAKCMILSKFTFNLFIIRTYQNQAVYVKRVRTLTKSIGTLKNDVSNNPHDLVETYLCNSASHECMYG